MSLPPQKNPLSKFVMTSLHVIYGFPPPNQKSWLRLCYTSMTNAVLSENNETAKRTGNFDFFSILSFRSKITVLNR